MSWRTAFGLFLLGHMSAWLWLSLITGTWTFYLIGYLVTR